MVDIDHHRTSALPHISAGLDERPGIIDGSKTDMWLSMLDDAASGKKLPEKSLFILGGSPESQREFLEALSTDPSGKKPQYHRHSNRPPPLANQFALGYAYHDVLDSDHEDILARISLYLLSDPSPSFASLLQPLLTPQTLRNTLVVILLDWAQPWSWLRQVRDWIQLLREILVSLDVDQKEVMEEVMVSWRDRGKAGGSLDGGSGGATVSSEAEVSLPLGPGEWEEALGVPLCVVCQNADKIDALERERGWKDDEFDFILQFLRTVLLKHGSSLIYTTPSVPSSLQTLIHSSLGIQSLLKRHPLKHNVVDRDRILIPPNWDSWGKIRVLRDGFDVEAISGGWSKDIAAPAPSKDQPDLQVHSPGAKGHKMISNPPQPESPNDPSGAISSFEQSILDPQLSAAASASNALQKKGLDGVLEVETIATQTFLAKQVEVLERLRIEHARKKPFEGADASTATSSSHQRSASGEAAARVRDSGISVTDEGRVGAHIGPMHFNIGGIQVDADDWLKRMKHDRDATRSPEPVSASVASPDGKSDSENLASFFANMIKRPGAGSRTAVAGMSASISPRPGP
ncbi:MAG: hypothetical protein M1829_003115 [Trizodia sp. TS-e1964]|nr:MAG: hypothetical protein M1829_003115 [Trizodia sp. TS-e1964]